VGTVDTRGYEKNRQIPT